jgi:hypothetical protein
MIFLKILKCKFLTILAPRCLKNEVNFKSGQNRLGNNNNAAKDLNPSNTVGVF